MTKNNLIIGFIVLIIIVFGAFYLFSSKENGEVINVLPIATTTPENTTPVNKIEYRNNDYGFVFSLPKSWEDYTVVLDPWEGYSLDSNGQQKITEEGFMILIRHPDWEYKSPRQDIPVMIFTLKQWDDLQKDKFHIGAAPIGPKEIGRNSKLVFATPARYNFSFLTGYEEVEEILSSNSFKAF